MCTTRTSQQSGREARAQARAQYRNHELLQVSQPSSLHFTMSDSVGSFLGSNLGLGSRLDLFAIRFSKRAQSAQGNPEGGSSGDHRRTSVRSSEGLGMGLQLDSRLVHRR